jgi:hypothetical protein
VGVGDSHRALEKSALGDPCGAGHLAVAVVCVPVGEHGVEIVFPARKHDGHARANRTLADYELSFSGNQCRVTHFETGDVGDRVEPAGRSADRQRKVTFTRMSRLRMRRERERHQDCCCYDAMPEHVLLRVGAS